MDYLTAWREGHEAGMQLVLKIINELTEHEFEKSSDVVMYIKQLEGNPHFYFEKQYEQPERENVTSDLSAKDKKFINRLSNKIAINNWLWSDK